MRQLNGVIKSILNADENEILCEVELDEILNPYFNIRNLHAEIISIDNIIDKKVILEKIKLLVGGRFNGIFIRPIGHNKIEIHIQKTKNQPITANKLKQGFRAS